MELDAIEDEVALLDAILKPIAKRPVDLKDPDWMTKLRESKPLDETGIRPEAEAVLRTMLATYAHGDDATRVAIRRLFDRYTSFRWAAHLPLEPGLEGFRLRLLHLSAVDQARDARDELLALDDLCARARSAGVDIGPTLVEVAAMSSDVNKHGMGSTRGFLLSRAQRHT
jgi:hypothetical protein